MTDALETTRAGHSRDEGARRCALVTGSGKRVGRAVALRLARAGFDIALHYNTSERDARAVAEECRRSGVNAMTFGADLSERAATASLVPRVLDAFGQLDCLVNNASTFPKMQIDEFELDAWDAALQVNLTAPMQLIAAASDALRAQHGVIVNFTDVSLRRPWPDHLAYMVAKGGLQTLTQALARALAPKVRVNAVAPGIAIWPDHYDEATKERLLARVPLARAGTPDEMADAVHYLVAVATYTTGVILPVDGGRSVV